MLPRKITVLLSALAMMMVMSAPVALAAGKADPNPKCFVTGFPVGCNGHKGDDGADPDEGGGNDHIKTNNRGGGND
jgi:hypothetical protein